MVLMSAFYGSFERYPEDEATQMYGRPGDDPHACEFPDFEYTNPIPNGEVNCARRERPGCTSCS